MALQRRLWRVNEAFARYNLAACIKAGLAVKGYDVGDPLPPQAPLRKARKAVEAVLQDLSRAKGMARTVKPAVTILGSGCLARQIR